MALHSAQGDKLRLQTSILFLTLAAIPACGSPPPSQPQPSSTSARGARIPDSLLALMTLEEKLGQLTMAPAEWDQTGPRRRRRRRAARCATGASARSSTSGAPRPPRRMQRIAVEESRLHIPLLFGYDVIHG